MSEDLLRKLKLLEEDYLGQPVFAQQADLPEINRLRAQLGLPLVDARLRELGAVAAPPETKPEPVVVPDYTEARAFYRAYLDKTAELEVHRDYADRVARATAGHGQTPVRPLATMGTGGGPLLCDHCGKPIVLEGGGYHGVPADVAWQKNPDDHWVSWILGGLVVEIQTNGTLRIYHGYPGRNDQHCCNLASREHDKAQKAHVQSKPEEKEDMLRAFLEHEFPAMKNDERLDLLREIQNTLFAYDPGIGVNRPDS